MTTHENKVFCSGLIFGCLLGFLVTLSVSVWWTQDRAIVREAATVQADVLGERVTAPAPRFPAVANFLAQRVPTSAVMLP